MVKPTECFLEALNRAWNSRQWQQDETALLGFAMDMDASWSDNITSLVAYSDESVPTVARPVASRDLSARILQKYEFAEDVNITQFKERLSELWTKEIAYPHGEWEFVDTPEGFSFFFFTHHPDGLFASGRVDFECATST